MSKLWKKMIFKQFYNKDLSIYSYIIGDSNTKECAVIDPIRLIDPIREYIKQNQLKVKYLIQTHLHADFITGVSELKAALNPQPVIVSSGMAETFLLPSYADELLHDKKTLQLNAIRLESRHTPGHTPEHLSFLCYDESRSAELPLMAFTGDFILAGSIGRPDLLGEKYLTGLADDLYNSTFKRISDWQDSLEIYPAHGSGSLCGKNISHQPVTTLGYEKKTNPEFKHLPQDTWVANILNNLPSAPKGFSHIKRLNLAGPRLMEKHFEIPKQIFDPRLAPAFLIDLRDSIAFSKGHIPGSLNIPYGPSFCHWCEWTAPYYEPILLILSDEHPIDLIAQKLWLIGLENLFGYSIYSPSLSDEQLPAISTEQLLSGQFQVIDVRSPLEWESGHIENALHIQLPELEQRLEEIPKNQQIAFTCGGGNRSSIAASLLRKHGYKNVFNVKGGMQDWKSKSFPTIKKKL